MALGNKVCFLFYQIWSLFYIYSVSLVTLVRLTITSFFLSEAERLQTLHVAVSLWLLPLSVVALWMQKLDLWKFISSITFCYLTIFSLHSILLLMCPCFFKKKKIVSFALLSISSFSLKYSSFLIICKVIFVSPQLLW